MFTIGDIAEHGRAPVRMKHSVSLGNGTETCSV